MNRVPYIQLGELCTVNQGLQIPISKRYKSNGPNRYFYITVQFLKESHVEKYYVENPPESSVCNKDDIIVVRTGSTGQILTGIEGCFHNNFFKVNYNSKKIVGKYLYYCLSSKEKQKEMKIRAGITTIPDLNHFMFLDMKIPFPSYDIQEDAVRILDSINVKIELNNKINAELEAMAKLIYDYWFVQFEFPTNLQDSSLSGAEGYKSSGGKMVFNKELKREIPEGWGVENIMHLTNLLGGGTPKTKKESYWSGTIPFFTPADAATSIFSINTKAYITKEGLDSCSSKLYAKGTIFITARGTVGKINIASEPMAMNQSCYAIQGKEDVASTFVYFYTNELVHYIKSKASGSIFKALVTNDFKFTKLSVPPKDLIKLFSSQIESSFDKILNNKKQNQQLTKLRDRLLPMLMNGQVTVKEAEEKVREFNMVAEPDGTYTNK